jgi:hypothetical protein
LPEGCLAGFAGALAAEGAAEDAGFGLGFLEVGMGFSQPDIIKAKKKGKKKGPDLAAWAYKSTL